MQLVINAGSSSVKYTLFSSLSSAKRIASGMFDRFGSKCTFSINDRIEHVSVHNHSAAVNFLLNLLFENNVVHANQITSVVHRVVHGGEQYYRPTIITQEVIDAIDELSLLAPLHNPANLDGILACQLALPDAMHIAVFDTAFHHTIHPEVFRYAIPKELYERYKIRKYGFHGSSHAYIARVLKRMYKKPVDAISCHLGAGSSIAALKRGKSADTTMGFTPLDGVMMATRSGDLDPEIPLFLQTHLGYSPSAVERLLNNKSGLFGIAGDADLRNIYQRARHGDEDAKLAIEMLSYRVAYFVNAMKTTVPHPKAIVFTAGIGERAWYVRKKVCEYLGLHLADGPNKSNQLHISTSKSPVDVLVIPTDEQLEMHLQARKFLPIELTNLNRGFLVV